MNNQHFPPGIRPVALKAVSEIERARACPHRHASAVQLERARAVERARKIREHDFTTEEVVEHFLAAHPQAETGGAAAQDFTTTEVIEHFLAHLPETEAGAAKDLPGAGNGAGLAAGDGDAVQSLTESAGMDAGGAAGAAVDGTGSAPRETVADDPTGSGGSVADTQVQGGGKGSRAGRRANKLGK
jgi:hypothetical protein